MNQIRSWLVIGKYRETLDRHLLKANRINVMLQLADLVEYPDIITLYLAIEDGEPLPFELLRKGVDFIIKNKKQGKRVLVACGAGISRSTSFAVASLKETEKLNLLQALQEVKRYHPEALPHPTLWQSLCEYYDEAIPFIDALRIG
jgi:protein-tyrosine phosphatase